MLPEAKIIFGVQHPGIKADISAGIIMEGALKIYVKIVDPQQFTNKWGLGKLLGHASGKASFPNRLKRPIQKINDSRNRLHPGHNGIAMTIDDLRKYSSEFINWFFEKLVKQKCPKEILNLIDKAKIEKEANKTMIKKVLSKTKLVSPAKTAGNKTSATHKSHLTNGSKTNKSISDKLNKLRKVSGSISAEPVEKDKKLLLKLYNEKGFSRTYYQSTILDKNQLRGVELNKLKYNLSGLNLNIIFQEGKISILNQSEKLKILFNNLILVRNRKKALSVGDASLVIDGIKLKITVNKF